MKSPQVEQDLKKVLFFFFLLWLEWLSDDDNVGSIGTYDLSRQIVESKLESALLAKHIHGIWLRTL